MNYEEKYKNALDMARECMKDGGISQNTIDYLRNIFPELAESRDERIRKTLIAFHKSTIDIDGIKGYDIIEWLEKQVPEPNWCHHKVDLSGYSEEYRKAYYDGWNNCNMQHSQCKIELDDVVKCLINGMKFYYEDNEDATWGTEKWSMPVKHIIDVLEKKGEQKSTDKAEPKFHKDDWIISNNKKSTYQVIEVKRGIYVIRDNVDNHEYHIGIEEAHKSGRLWIIEEAEDGDYLTVNGRPFIYCCYDDYQGNYCCIDSNGEFRTSFNFGFNGKNIFPATKEQRDYLFKKMKEADYEWDDKNKELKNIETKGGEE